MAHPGPFPLTNGGSLSVPVLQGTWEREDLEVGGGGAHDVGWLPLKWLRMMMKVYTFLRQANFSLPTGIPKSFSVFPFPSSLDNTRDTELRASVGMPISILYAGVTHAIIIHLWVGELILKLSMQWGLLRFFFHFQMPRDFLSVHSSPSSFSPRS